MSPSDPDPAPLTPTQAVAQRIRDLRKQHKWTAQDLAEAMTKVGIQWDRYVVTNLERGRRQTLSLDEVLALAYVLDVAPVHLLIATDATDETRYLPAPVASVDPRMMRAWIRGQWPLPGQDARFYFAEVPESEWEPPKPSLHLQQGLTDIGRRVTEGTELPPERWERREHRRGDDAG